MGDFSIGFDGKETSNTPGCDDCGEPMHAHEKKRVYPDDGPAGAYHYEYVCP